MYTRLQSAKEQIILEFEQLTLQHPTIARTVLMQTLAQKYECSYNTIGNYVGWAREPVNIQKRQRDAHEARARKGGPSFAPVKLQDLTPEKIIRDWSKITA